MRENASTLLKIRDIKDRVEAMERAAKAFEDELIRLALRELFIEPVIRPLVDNLNNIDFSKAGPIEGVDLFKK